SFCQGAERGHFPDLSDRDNLWRLLVVVTARKAAQVRRDQARLKRGGGQVRGEADLEGSSEDGPALAEVVGQEPTPDFAASVAEGCQRVLGLLDDDLRSRALARMEGHTNEEIAARLGCAARTVERKVRVIRGLWEQGGTP